VSADHVAFVLSELHNEDVEHLSQMEQEFYFALADAVYEIKTSKRVLSLLNLSRILKVSTSELDDYTTEILSLEDRYEKNKRDEVKSRQKQSEVREKSGQ